MDLRVSAALLVGCLSAPLAAAQTPSYPTQPVRVIVPTSPGGVTVALARALGQRLAEIWGQQVVIENRAGANHAIAL
jgi:tripartite-type tricarboxylate transporter receptor subunit TctC